MRRKSQKYIFRDESNKRGSYRNQLNKALFSQIRDVTENAGSKLLIVPLPEKKQLRNTKMKTRGEKLVTEWFNDNSDVNIISMREESGLNENNFLPNYHFNQKGHALVARVVGERIKFLREN